MEINNDCIRDVLAHLVNILYLEVCSDGMHGENTKTNLYEVINQFKGKHDESDVWYSVEILNEIGYIRMKNNRPKSRIILNQQEIHHVTYAGQQFYELTKPETIWKQTKGVLTTVGVHTLEFVEKTAHDMAVKSAEVATKIALTGQA